MLNDLPIYLVSLEQDAKRREELKKLFPKHYSNFIHIPAVDGRMMPAREYYQQTLPYYLKYNKPMSPAEWGCTSSHIKALEAFLLTGKPYALVLEDDVIGNDQEIEDVLKLANNLSINSLLLCGAQEGVNRRYQLGTKLTDKKIYEVHSFSYQFVFRTCCYLVTKKSAQEILDSHENCLTLADKWDQFFKGTTTKIYYVGMLKHPEDLASSHIEGDRELFKQKTLLKKLLSKDSPFKIFRKIKNEVYRFNLVLFGYKQIK